MYSVICRLFVILILWDFQEYGFTSEPDHQCARYNHICNPDHPLPCCQVIFSCKLKQIRNAYVCQEKAKLGASCFNDEDCSEIIHAKCSTEKKCVCRSNNLRINETHCAPLLGGFCWKNEACATDNALCINNECQCREKHLEAGDQCLSTYLEMPCTDDMFCNKLINHTICSENKKCVCDRNSLQSSKNTCTRFTKMSKLDYQDNCSDKNSTCFDNKCYYRSMVYLGDQVCNEDKDCCAKFLGESCHFKDDCQVYNSICFDKKCRCEVNYSNSSIYECLPIFLHKKCRTNNDCRNTPNSICLNYKCVCKIDYMEANDMTCLARLGTDCTVSKDCGVKNSICYDGECKCYDYYVQQSNDHCLSTILSQSCTSYDDCKNIKFANCSNYNMCFCERNYVAVKSRTCGALLGQSCSKDIVCATNNSLCVDNKCQCRPFCAADSSNTQCLPIHLEKSCSKNTDCRMIRNAYCRKKRCVCNQNYAAVSSTICVPVIDGACEVDEDCYAHNSVCIDNKCKCKTHFAPADSNSRCHSIALGNPCDFNSDCSMILNSVCSSSYICICRPNYFASGNFSCVPTLNAVCSNDCFSDSFHCVNNKCQCKPNFTAISIDKCVETRLLYSCKDLSECSDSWHWDCSLIGKCVCQVDNIAVTTSTCLPILHGYCWRDDQCVAENSACIDFYCECKPNFVAAADNFCAAKI